MGEGSTGAVVQEVRRNSDNEKLAIKILTGMDRGHWKQVKKEIDRMKTLEPHPRIVKYWDAFTASIC